MAAVQGWGTRVGLGAESTYGTAVTRTAFIEVVSADFNKKSVLAAGETLAGASTSYEAAHRDRMLTEAGGSMQLVPEYEGQGLLWQHLMGNTASTSGSGPYVHTLHLAWTMTPLTTEVVHGAAVQGGTTVSEVFDGGMCTSWSLSCTVGQRAKLDTTWIHEDSAGPAGSPTSATYTTNRLRMLGHEITLVWNSTTFKVYNFRLGVDRALERDYPLGSRLTLQPMSTRGALVTFEAEIRLEDWALPIAQHAATSATGTLTISDGTNSFVFTLRQLAWDEAMVSHSSQGKQTVRVRGQGLGSTSASTVGLTLVATNSQSSFTA